MAQNDTNYSAGKEKMTAHSIHEIRTIDIKLDGYGLDIQKRNDWLKKTSRLCILKSLSTTFEPGVLNVIMGSSGSGKTTLLNSMAHRLQHSTSTQYQIAGKTLFNGAVPSESSSGQFFRTFAKMMTHFFPTLLCERTCISQQVYVCRPISQSMKSCNAPGPSY